AERRAPPGLRLRREGPPRRARPQAGALDRRALPPADALRSIGRRAQSRYFQVAAPSRCRTRRRSRTLGSKLRAFTPVFQPSGGLVGAQCVTPPHVEHLTNRRSLSPHTYADLARPAPWMRTASTL